MGIVSAHIRKIIQFAEKKSSDTLAHFGSSGGVRA
jgi:hypothetical protein